MGIFFALTFPDNLYLRSMNAAQKKELERLIEKYNPILLNSMSIALSEDLVSLIISNQDDESFQLNSVLQDKDAFRQFVTTTFLKNNSSSLARELKSMDEHTFTSFKKKK
jgi:hypothetical protein